MSATDQVDKALGWVERAIKFFAPYNPEVKSLSVNLRSCESELDLVVQIPDTIRRKVAKISIPAYGSFVIDYVMDQSFNKIPNIWHYYDGKWVADASALPRSESLLIKMRGRFPAEMRSELVRIQPARNRDRTEAVERYWLDSMIRSPEALESLYKSVNVDEVAVGVKISLQRSFAATLPKEVSRKLQATARWIQVGRTLNRQKVFNEWMGYRTAQKGTEVTVEEIVGIVYQLTAAEVFSRHVSVDAPYTVGEIARKDPKTGPIPEDMEVEACTRLTLKTPVAQGHLVFAFKAFEDEISRALSPPRKPMGTMAEKTKKSA